MMNQSLPAANCRLWFSASLRSQIGLLRIPHTRLRAQIPTLEFLPRRPEVAQMVNRRPHRRERERLKLLVEHLLQVILGGEPDRDVWIEFLAGPVGHERSSHSRSLVG